MRPLTLLLALALAGCRARPAAPAPAVDAEAAAAPAPRDAGAATVTFGARPFAVGEVFTDAVTSSMAGETPEPVDTESRVSYRAEVLAADGVTLQAVKVTYLTEEDTDRRAKKTGSGLLPGRTFTLSVKDGALVALLPDGSPAPAPLVERLRADWTTLGKPDPFRTVLSGVTLEVGQPYTPVARALADTFNAGWSNATTTASARLAEVRGPLARFDVTADQVVLSDAGQQVVSRLTGTLDLRLADGEFAALTLEGPMRFEAQGQVVGTARMVVTSTRQ